MTRARIGLTALTVAIGVLNTACVNKGTWDEDGDQSISIADDQVDVSVTWDGSTWTFCNQYTLDCDGTADCDQVQFRLWDPSTTASGSLTIDLAYSAGGSDSHTYADANFTSVDSSGVDIQYVAGKLDSGTSVDVDACWTPDTATGRVSEYDGGDLDWYRVELDGSGDHLYVLRPILSPTLTDRVGDEWVQVDTVTEVPDDHHVVAPGTASSTTADGSTTFTHDNSAGRARLGYYRVFIGEGHGAIGSATTRRYDGGTTTVTAHRWDGLADGGDIDDYVDGTASQDLDADIDRITDLVGAFDLDTEHVIYLPEDAASRGQKFSGISLVPADATWPHVTVHELTHAIYGIAVAFDDDAWWQLEAVPTVMEAVIHDPVDHPSSQDPASEMIAVLHQTISGGTCDLEADGDAGAGYDVGMLAVHDHQFATMATQGYTMTEVWAEYASFMDDHWRTEVDAGELETFVDGLVADFYDERVAPGCPGLPILGITDVSYTDDANDASATDGGSYTIEQLQGSYADLPANTFSNVPYHLACRSTHQGTTEVGAFTACAVGDGGVDLWNTTPHLLDAASSTEPLSEAELGVPHVSVEVTLFHAGGLLWTEASEDPDDDSRYVPATWCGNDPDCDTTDADSDGFPADDGDCDDHDATVYPGAPEAFDSIDQDCNGVN